MRPEYYAGWINLDCTSLDGVDVVADLDDCGHTPLPFDDDCIDEFHASHLIEHLKNPLPFMQELWRTAKRDAKAVFRVPYGSSDTAYEDPTHVRAYFMQSFDYFSQPAYWRADYGYSGDWQVEKIYLKVDKNRFAGKKIEEITFAVQNYRNIVKEMVVELKAIKPPREPKKELQTTREVVYMLE